MRSSRSDRASVARPGERGVEVRMVVFQAPQPERLLGAAELVVRLARRHRRSARRTPADAASSSPSARNRSRAYSRIVSSIAKRAVAVAAAARDDQALVAQRREEAERGLVVTEHGGRSREREAAGEDGELLQRRLLVRREQRRSSSRSSQRASAGAPARLAGRPVRNASRRSRRLEDLGQRQQPDAGGRELDRERQAVEPPADRAHLLDLAARRLGCRRARPARGRGTAATPSSSTSDGTAYSVSAVTCRRSRLVASTRSRGHAATRSATSGAAAIRRSKLSSTSSSSRSRRLRASASAGGLARLLGEAERPGDDRRDGVRVVDAREPDEESAVAVRRDDGARDLDRQPRLADPARAGQRQHRRPRERVEDLPRLLATADERGARQR